MHRVFQGVYENVQFAKLKLLARALERAQVYEGGELVVSYLLRGDFSAVGAAKPYSEGIIDYLRAVEGAIVSVLIREPPRSDGPTRRVSLRSSTDEVDVSAIARKSSGGGHRQAAGSRARSRSPRSPSSSEASTSPRVVPRALEPAGVVLRRQAGGALVVQGDRRAAPANRCAHRSCRHARPVCDRPAVVLSGWTTKLQPCFVGLDKRYVTDVDLSATTSTGDPEGDVLEQHDAARCRRAGGAARGPPR